MPNTDTLNPIRAVGSFNNLPAPASYSYNLQDLSAPDAGRTEDMTMHKKRIGQLVAVELGWKNLTTYDLNQVLSAFNPEYVDVTYIDPLFGNPNDNFFYQRNFYVSDRSAPLRDAVDGLWSGVNFKIIARVG